MASPGIRDLLASFSPSSDFFAIASADGRIKIWDTLKGQVQTEFSDFKTSSNDSETLFGSKKGHLALDYKCMKWVQLGNKVCKFPIFLCNIDSALPVKLSFYYNHAMKKKKKHLNSLLVLGTGDGDVLAVEVSTGQLRWRVCDCHSGGVSAISFCRDNSFLYTAGLDGMVCQIDCSVGSVIKKFTSSTKGISALAISADGNMLAAAAGLLKVFSCADHTKIQKFSGHPVSVRCMIFSEDGKSILSSGVGERHIAIWKIDGTKKKSASCVLSMEHPAIFLDSRGSNQEDLKLRGLFVLALSEIGVCYFWHGNRIEDLPNARPTKISPEIESFSSKGNNRAIFAAKLDCIVRSSVASVRVAHGSLIKPSFEKLIVEHGVDISLNTSKDGVLFHVGQSHISSKGKVVNAKVYTLDSANAEDAILPIAKLHVNEKKRKNCTPYPALDFEKSKFDVDTRKRKSSFSPNEVSMQIAEVDEPICIEDRLRVAGLLEDKDKLGREDFSNGFDEAIMYDSLDFIVDVNLPRKKIRSQISKMTAGDACKMLELLVPSLRTGSASSKHLLPWIYYILVIHGQFIISHDSCSEMLDNLEKMTRLKSAAIHPLLKLSGRLQLIMTQIDKAGTGLTELPSVEKFDINEDEESDEDDGGDFDEMLYDDDDDESGSDD